MVVIMIVTGAAFSNALVENVDLLFKRSDHVVHVLDANFELVHAALEHLWLRALASPLDLSATFLMGTFLMATAIALAPLEVLLEFPDGFAISTIPRLVEGSNQFGLFAFPPLGQTPHQVQDCLFVATHDRAPQLAFEIFLEASLRRVPFLLAATFNFALALLSKLPLPLLPLIVTCPTLALSPFAEFIWLLPMFPPTLVFVLVIVVRPRITSSCKNDPEGESACGEGEVTGWNSEDPVDVEVSLHAAVLACWLDADPPTPVLGVACLNDGYDPILPCLDGPMQSKPVIVWHSRRRAGAPLPRFRSHGRWGGGSLQPAP